MPRKQDLTGRRFGKLLVVGEAGRDPYGSVTWNCHCDCGGSSVVRGTHLTGGATQSCGCGVIEAATRAKTKHGGSNTPLYSRWRAMNSRCNSGNPNYGSRGITVCERWLSFEAFSEDMGPSFLEGLELDRIDNDGNYEPGNCRWASRVQQQRNRRNNHRVAINGRTMTLADWEEETGIKANTILTRIRRGWPESRWLTVLAEMADAAPPSAPGGQDE